MKKIYLLLRPYFRPYLPYVIGSAACAPFLAGIKASHAYMVKVIVDIGFKEGANFSVILFIAGAIIGLSLLNFPIRFLHLYLIRYVVEKVGCGVRSDLYTKLQNMPMLQFQKNRQGEFLSSFVSDAQIFSKGVLSFVDIIREFFVVTTLFCYAFYRDWKLTMVIVVAIPVFVFILQKVGKGVRLLQGLVQGEVSNLMQNISEGLQGQKLIKAFGIQAHVGKRFEQIQNHLFQSTMKMTKVEQMARPLFELVVAFCLASTSIMAFHRISSGSMSSGDFISFITAWGLLMEPLRSYTQANGELNQAIAAGDRISKILQFDEEEDTGNIAKTTFESKIEIKNVAFSYGEKDILKDFSLEVARGEKVAIVGMSGSGKSTLVNILLRLYDIDRGEIKIDGVPINQLTLHSLRSLFGLVSQDVFLFNDTVRQNIILNQIYSKEEIEEAIKVSQSGHFIDQLPQALETTIGDRGARLSGGQAQRLAIARAYLRKNPILIFDEATSALDNKTEEIIQKSLQHFLASYTVIAVAHRLSSIQHYDRIVVLKGGVKVEEGSHKELMSLGGEYSKLYKLSL